MGVNPKIGVFTPPKSSILIRISIINHPFWDTTIFGNTHIYIYYLYVQAQKVGGNDPRLTYIRIFFKWVETTNYSNICIFIQHPIIFFGCHWFPFVADLTAWICSKIIGKGPIGEKQTLENCSSTTFERGAWSSCCGCNQYFCLTFENKVILTI